MAWRGDHRGARKHHSLVVGQLGGAHAQDWRTSAREQFNFCRFSRAKHNAMWQCGGSVSCRGSLRRVIKIQPAGRLAALANLYTPHRGVWTVNGLETRLHADRAAIGSL